MNKVFLGLVVAAGLLSSCATSNKTAGLAGEWKIVSVEGQKVSSENHPFLGFDLNEGRLYGNAGCNNIMATMTVDKKKGLINLSEVGSTRKMCRDMKLEGQVLGALSKVSAYRSTKAGIELTDAGGNVLFGLQKKCSGCVSNLKGEWIITTVEGRTINVVENVPFLAFDTAAMKVHGNGGCNIINGSFEHSKKDAGSLRFGKLVTTMKAGPGMEQESLILPALENVRSFEMKADGTLALKDKKNNVIVVLEKNDGKSLSK